MAGAIDIPACILYHKILQIDKRFEQFMPNTSTQVDINSLYHRHKHEKRFQALVRRNEEQIKKHFGIINYSSEEGQKYTKIYWKLYPIETRYMFGSSRALSTRFMSQSLENKIMDAMMETLKPPHQSANISLFATIASLEKDINDDRHYTINSKGEMTFTPKGKETIIADDVWKTHNRQSIKYGKGIRKIFENDLFKVSDDVIEKISNYVKSAYTFNGTFKIVNGEDIRYWYHEANYGRKVGSLSQSCMRYRECQEYMDIYVKNPDRVSMLIAVINDKLIGRAILWTPDNYNKTIMDRIYGDDLTIEAFKEYAKQNDWAYKKYQNHSDTDDWENAENIPGDICITLNNQGISKYPYIDSFRYAEEMTDKLTLYANCDMDTYTFNNINGGYEGGEDDENRIRCHCGNYYDEDETVYSSYIDEYIFEPNAVYSEFHDTYLPSDMAVRMNGDYVDPEHDDICYSENNDAYYYYEDVVFVENESDYYEHNQVVEDYQGEYVPEENARTYDIEIEKLAELLETEIDNTLTLISGHISGNILNDNSYRVYYHDSNTDVEEILDYVYRRLERLLTRTA